MHISGENLSPSEGTPCGINDPPASRGDNVDSGAARDENGD